MSLNGKFRLLGVRFQPLILALGTYICLSLLGTELNAQNRFWINPAGGRYDISGNWEDGIPPAATENARFALDENYTVIWNSLSGNTTSDDLTLVRGNVVFASRSGSFAHTADRLMVDTGSTAIPPGSLQLGDSPGSAFQILSNSGYIRMGSLSVLHGSSIKTDGSFTVDGIGAGTGFVRVAGTGSRITVGSELQVGLSGAGRLTIESGGVVESAGAEIGRGFAPDGYELLLRGTDSTWTDSGSVIMHKGLFEVSSNATFNSNLLGLRGGEMRVTGDSTNWQNSTSISVSGGVLDLSDGAKTTTAGMSIRNGTVQLSRDAVLTISGDLEFDDRFSGERILAASLGAQVSNVSARLGVVAEKVSRAAFSQGSTWTNTEKLLLGEAGTGIFTLSETSTATAQSLELGGLASGVGQANLSSGSMFTVSQTVDVGGLGRGEVTVSSGSVLQSDRMMLGVEAGGSGTVSVSGTGSALMTNEDLTVGHNGNGELNVLLGGFASNASGVLGSAEASTGTASIDGLGSQWINNGNLAVGLLGTGQLRLTNGGLVSVGGTTSINDSSSILLDGGRLEFGEMALAELDRINARSGSLAGTVHNTEHLDASSIFFPINSRVDVTELLLSNTGRIFGSGSIDVSLANAPDGTVQVVTGERLQFGGRGINAGEINNTGGVVGFDGVLENRASGFIGGRGVFSAEQGFENSGVMAFTGTADVFGDVEMQAGSQLVTSGFATTTLFDDVVFNDTPGNRAEIRTSEGSATVILGGISGDMNFTGTGQVFAEGDLRPGNSPGVGLFEGDLYLGNTAVTFIEIAGTDFDQFDTFQIDGDFGLDGSLSVGLFDGFSLGFGQEFLIADVEGSMTGMFSGLGEGDLVGNYGGRDLFITYNGFSGNRGVGLFTAVPEPSSAMLLLALGALTSLRRRRK